MNDVDVDVIIDRRKAYGLADGKPFYARIASTSSYLGCGHSYWEVTGDFTAPEKRIIARALWKTMESEQEKGNIKFYKQCTFCRDDINAIHFFVFFDKISCFFVTFK